MEQYSKMKKTATILAAFLAAFGINADSKTRTPQLRADNIDEIIGAMSLKEKARLVVGAGWGSMLGSDFLSASKVRVPGAAGMTREIKRLGIPSIVLSDGPAGLRIKRFCTGFPVGTLLACSWNTELVEEVGRAMGNEVLEYGVDVILGPGMNLMRNPLCGRNFEYYSEDPLLSGKTAAAMIRGIQSNGVGTSAKHFAANSQETNRLANDARIDEKTLRELYLKGFEIAVKEAAPWTIMSSYNKINGTYTQEDPWLLTEVLRGEWGFEGLVMSDWTGTRNTAAQIAAGNDLLQPGNNTQINDIVRKVRRGDLSEESLNTCVKRVLELIVKTPHFNNYPFSNAPDLEAHALVSRKAATEGMVLLENRDALPLAPGGNAALFGVGAYDFIAGGTGSGNVNKPHVINLVQGLGEAGFSIDPKLSERYGNYLSDKHNRKSGYVMVGDAAWIEMKLDPQTVKTGASENELAIFVIQRQAGEGEDRAVENDFNLSETERENLETVCKEFHALGKKVIVILNVGGVIETASWKNLPDAVLVAWAPGQEGGYAIADILTGKANPSGKLSMSFPLSYEDIPSSANFPAGVKSTAKDMISTMTGPSKDSGRKDIDYTEYAEGMNVGYRYFGLEGNNVSYPFGYGLSYTSFSEDRVENADGSVSVTVTNTGNCEGKHVVALYRDGILAAFAKTALLKSGESVTLRF